MQNELHGRDLFDEVMNHLAANPHAHDQGTYGRRADGVMTGCVAFWAVILVDGADAVRWQESCHCCRDQAEMDLYIEAIDTVIVGNDEVAISTRARELFGLSWFQSDELFHPRNTTAADLYAVADRVFVASE